MLKKKSVQKFHISVTWVGKEQMYMRLRLDKDSCGYRLNCKKLQEFVSMLQQARDTQNSVDLGNMAIDKLTKNEIRVLQHHMVEVEPCYFCKKDNQIFVVNTEISYNGYRRDNFSVCKKHLNELTQFLEDLETNGSYEVKGQNNIEVTVYQEEV